MEGTKGRQGEFCAVPHRRRWCAHDGRSGEQSRFQITDLPGLQSPTKSPTESGHNRSASPRPDVSANRREGCPDAPQVHESAAIGGHRCPSVPPPGRSPGHPAAKSLVEKGKTRMDADRRRWPQTGGADVPDKVRKNPQWRRRLCRRFGGADIERTKGRQGDSRAVQHRRRWCAQDGCSMSRAQRSIAAVEVTTAMSPDSRWAMTGQPHHDSLFRPMVVKDGPMRQIRESAAIGVRLCSRPRQIARPPCRQVFGGEKQNTDGRRSPPMATDRGRRRPRQSEKKPTVAPASLPAFRRSRNGGDERDAR
jgi:hypothetical protein